MINILFFYLLRQIRSKILLILYLFLTNITLTHAATFNVNVKVIVLVNTCDIYGPDGRDKPINVELSDMLVGQIDGKKYETAIPFNIACSDGASNPALKLQFSGTGAKFNTTLLGTSESNLGLQFRVNNQTLALGSWSNFNFSQKPNLTVIPLVNSPQSIIGGNFTASTILKVDYQ